jgi:RNA polymerase sigma factor (sigma-70 family)
MPSDPELYRLWLEARDEGAFAALARRHANLVVDVAWRAGGDRHVAEDALQEALLALARDGTRRPADAGVRAWLARLAISKARNARASEVARRRRERQVAAERPMHAEDATVGRAVEQSLARFDGESTAVLALRFLHDMPYPELAAVLDVAESTARVRVHRALEKLRAELRRDDVDDEALAGFLAAMPARTASSVSVEAAITAALDGAAAAYVVASPTVAPWISRTRAIATLALLAAASGGLLWWASAAIRPERATSGASTSREHAAVPGGARGATLRGHTADAPPVASAPMPTTLPVAGKRSPAPAPSSVGVRGESRDDGRVPLRARMVIVLADGTEEDLAIDRVRQAGREYLGSMLTSDPGRLRVDPGWPVHLSTEDDRAAIRGVTARVPTPPGGLVVRVPAKGHPCLAALALEVVDAGTGAPLPDSWLEWGGGTGPSVRIPADAHGRIPVRLLDGASRANDGEPLLRRLEVAEHVVHAPGHFATSTTRGREEFVPASDADHLATWLERGVARIALRPLPADAGYTERQVRLLDAQGQPASGAYVLVALPTRRDFHFLMAPWQDGFRRADEDGCFTVLLQKVVGLEVRIEAVPVAAWDLSEESWPEAGPRVLRLPAIVWAELVVEDLPSGGRWARDPLGAKRTPEDGPGFLRECDPRARELLEQHDAVLPSVAPDGARGDLVAPRSVLRLPLPVGRSFVLHLFAGDEHRAWTVSADAPGSLHQVRSWSDIPLAPRGGG